MRHLRIVATVLALFAVVGTTLAGAANRSSAPPKNLHGFLLRPGEKATHVFARTPAFAWSPVSGARCYQFEIGTSKTFTENSLIWSNVPYVTGHHSGCPTVPAISIDTALPWFTGTPYALYAHVRAVTSSGTTKWSSAFGFDMQWQDLPKQKVSEPGLLRWTPVEGATRYQIFFPDIDTPLVTTNTNVADEREFYTFHTDPSFTQTVHWRVRAVREVFGDIPNGLPPVSYGPWSQVFTSVNPPVSTGQLSLGMAVSDTTSSAKKPAAHELMPALTWSGTSIGTQQYSLWRAYAFTDKDCVNVVFRGAVVGGPAYAPRMSGPLKLPTSDTDLQIALTGYLPSSTTEPNTFDRAGATVTTNESPSADTAATGSTSGSTTTTTTSGSSASSIGSAGASVNELMAKVDLPDLNFPSTKYFWTVVPVVLTMNDAGAIQYHDAEVAQDACSAGRIASFGKQSAPVTATAGTPFVSGLSPSGRLLATVSHKPVVYGTPLVAWQPALAATSYEIQWSRTLYPWRPTGSKTTSATATVINLKPGRWYYRIRGLNSGALKIPAMRWSTPVQVSVARPTFRILASSSG